MIFSDDRAYEQLRDEGVVLTARASKKPDGPVWIRRSRTGPKDEDVPYARRILFAELRPLENHVHSYMNVKEYRVDNPEKRYELAGFDSADAWLDAVYAQNAGKLPDEIYVYRMDYDALAESVEELDDPLEAVPDGGRETRGSYTEESEPVDSNCPQGCVHPSGLTMHLVVEKHPRGSPVVIETPNGPVVSRYRTERYQECRVCGWRIDG